MVTDGRHLLHAAAVDQMTKFFEPNTVPKRDGFSPFGRDDTSTSKVRAGAKGGRYALSAIGH